MILFLQPDNMANIVRAVSETGIIAVGMTFVIITAGIDLSVGALLSLSQRADGDDHDDAAGASFRPCCSSSSAARRSARSQGVISTRFRLEPFIVTLAGLQVARGLALVISNNQYINISYGDGPGLAPPVFAILGDRLFNHTVPVATLVFVVVAVVAVFVLNFTRFGRYVFAVGGNERAARLSGVPVTMVKVSVYAITGLVSAIAGIVHAGQFNFGSANDGTGYELDRDRLGGDRRHEPVRRRRLADRHRRRRGDARRARQHPAAQQHQRGAATARHRRDHRAGGGVAIASASPRGIPLIQALTGQAPAPRLNVPERTGGTGVDNEIIERNAHADRGRLGAGAQLASARRAHILAKACGKDDKYVIGFSQANNAEPYRAHVNDQLNEAAKKVPQFTLQIADGAGNVNTQTSQMDNFITQKVDLILISPFEAAPLTPVVKRAMQAGIPVIELDRKTVGDPGKDYTAFIGGDNYKIAQEAGHYVAEKLLPDGGEVAVLEGLPSSTPAVERLNGFKDGVKGNGKIQVVAEQAADWVPDKAQTAFAAMLQAHPEHQGALRLQRHDGGRRTARRQRRRQEGRRHQDPRHRRPAGAGRRHPRGRARRMGGDLHLSDRRPGGDRNGEEDPARLRRQCATVVTVPTQGDHA